MPRPNRRHLVLDAALRLVQRDGVVPTMEAIAEQAGMSRQALYLHFAGPEDLFIAMVDRLGETHARDEGIGQVLAAEEADERLDRFVSFVSRYWREVGPIVVAFEHASRGNAQARPAWEDRMRGLRALSRSVLRRFDAEGRLGAGWSLETATDALWALAGPIHHGLLVGECGWTDERYQDYVRHSTQLVLLGGQNPSTRPSGNGSRPSRGTRTT